VNELVLLAGLPNPVTVDFIEMKRRYEMKSVFRLLVFSVTVICLLSVAIPRDSLAAKKKIVLWRLKTYVKDAEKVLDKHINEWAKKNNVEVSIELYTHDERATKFTAAIESKTLPDVAELFAYEPSRLYGINRLEDVSDLVNDISKQLGEPVANLVGNMKFGGKFYSVPHYASPMIIFYRKDILRKINAKPPKTWNELWDQAKKIKETGLQDYPAGFPWNRTSDGTDPALSIFWNYGASWCDKDGYYKSINTPDGLKAINCMVRACFEGSWAPDYLAWSGGANNEAWLAGKISFTANSPSILWQLATYKHPLQKDTGTIVMPSGPAGHTQPLLYLMSWAVPKDRGNSELAKSLIKYIMSKKKYEAYENASAMQAGPFYQDLMASSYWADENGKVIVQSIKQGAQLGWPGPTTPAASEVMTTNILTDIVGRIVVDKLSKEATLKEADGKIRAIYERFKMTK
jgi:multiple sugar transport system substrate-binding protein